MATDQEVRKLIAEDIKKRKEEAGLDSTLDDIALYQAGDISALDLPKKYTGLSLAKALPRFLIRRNPYGLAATTFGPEIIRALENLIPPSKEAVTDTGNILKMSVDDSKGIFGGKGINILGGAPIDLTDEKIIKILENSRKGVYKSDLQAALEIQKLNPGSGLVVTNDKVAGGFQTTDKFRKLLKDYKSGKDDIFEADIAVGGSNIGRNVKNKILQAKEIADADISNISYAIKFRKALSNFFKPKFAEDVFDNTDGVFYPPTLDGTIKKSKAILEYLGDDPKLLNLAKTGVEGSGLSLWNKIKINSDEPIKGEALNYFKKQIIFDDTGKAFEQVKSDLIKKNKFVSSKLLQAKNLFENKSVNFFDVDHIQAPRFGGTNAETNLQLLPVGEHKLLKQLTPDKTIASKAVKSKTNFEIEFFNKSTEVVNLIKKGDAEKAMKLSSDLDNLVSDFKNTFKNINFKVAEPHVPIKTGDKTGKYIKYSDKLKLSSEQKELVNTLLNKDKYSNLSNVGKTIEQQANEILNMYEQVALISPTGKIPSKSLKIPGDITSMDVPPPAGEVNLRKDFSGMRDGGIVDIFKMTRSLNAER